MTADPHRDLSLLISHFDPNAVAPVGARPFFLS
jgi:hypothetical protein